MSLIFLYSEEKKIGGGFARNLEHSGFSRAFFQNATQCFQSLHHRVCIDFRHGFASRLSCSRHPPADHNTTGLEKNDGVFLLFPRYYFFFFFPIAACFWNILLHFLSFRLNLNKVPLTDKNVMHSLHQQ